MSRDAEAVLQAFDVLRNEDKRAVAEEVLRRSMPFDSGAIEDAEIGAASIALFESLSREDDDSRPRLSLALRLRNGRQG
jgi:hypothetical protein